MISSNSIFRTTALVLGTLMLWQTLPAQVQDRPAPQAESEAEPAPAPIRLRRDPLLTILGDSHLPATETARDVISIGGSSWTEGATSSDVVSIAGNTRVDGPAGGSAVAIIGNVYVNSRVGNDVVAILGNVELGPLAQVGGEVVSIGGTLDIDPAASVRRGIVSLRLGQLGTSAGALNEWVRTCLMLGRPLAFGSVGWAWGVAVVILLGYILVASLFPGAISRCASTFEQRPGGTILASVLAALAAPLVTLLLVGTGIGIVVVPFLAIALVLATWFGRAVFLAWIGRRILPGREGSASSAAVAVLIGGVIVALLYAIPVLGGVLWKLVGFLGFGVVVYTVLLEMRRSNAAATATGFQMPQSTVVPVGPAAAAGDLSAPTLASPPPIPERASIYPYAGFWIRLFALLLDVLIIGLLLGPVTDGVGVLPGLAVYGACMWKLRGTTIGGIVFGIEIMRVDGRPVDWTTAIVRALGCFLSAAVAGLGFLWVAFDREKQSWHDKIAGTVVVRPQRGRSLV
jgi:uncharacterized RDD family membrane protein YckC